MSSQNFEQLINTYHTVFLICGIIAIVLLVAAIVLFIVLGIPQVFNELSGRGAKKGIAEITESGASGALTSRNLTPSGKVKEKTGRTGFLGGGPRYRKAINMTEDLTTGKMGQRIENPGMQPPPAVNSQIPQPLSSGIGPVQNNYAPGQEPLDPQQNQMSSESYGENYGSEETGVLDSYTPETSVLEGYGSEETGALGASNGPEPSDEYFDDLADTTQLSAAELPNGGMYQGGAIDETTQLDVPLEDPYGSNAQAPSAGIAGTAANGYVDPNDAFGETSLLGTPIDRTPGFTVLRTILEVHTDEVIS